MKKRLLIIALALIMVLSTACASNPAPATDPTTAPVEATEAPATEPEATAEPAPAEEPFRVAFCCRASSAMQAGTRAATMAHSI